VYLDPLRISEAKPSLSGLPAPILVWSCQPAPSRANPFTSLDASSGETGQFLSRLWPAELAGCSWGLAGSGKSIYPTNTTASAHARVLVRYLATFSSSSLIFSSTSLFSPPYPVRRSPRFTRPALRLAVLVWLHRVLLLLDCLQSKVETLMVAYSTWSDSRVTTETILANPIYQTPKLDLRRATRCLRSVLYACYTLGSFPLLCAELLGKANPCRMKPCLAKIRADDKTALLFLL